MWRVFRSSSLFRQTTNCTTREKSTHSPSSGTSPWTDADVTAGCATIAAAVLLSQSQTQSQSRAPCDAEGGAPPPSPHGKPSPVPPPPPVNANFRERRLTTKYVKYKPSASATAAAAAAPAVEAGKEGGSGYVGLEIRDAAKDNVMYPAPFGSAARAEENAAESAAAPCPPFPPGKVGSYSYHGLEPRFLYGMVEVEEEEEEEEEDKEAVKPPQSPSLLSNLFGSTATVAPDTTTAAAAPTLAKKTRRQMVKVLHHKINQDRGHVVRPYGSHDRTALFAVYDGHGAKGELLAEYTMQALNDKLQLHPSYPRDSTTPTPTTTPDDSQTVPDAASEEMSTALRETICAIDREIRKTAHLESKCSGSTACVAVLRNDTLWVANVGDSRAVLGRRNERTVEGGSSGSDGEGSNGGGASGGGLCAIDLSTDQNANDPRERDRILAAGGFITFPDDKTLSPRVWLDQRCTMVGLAMSRSIGDHALESVGVMAEPVVKTYEVEKGDEFLILASDGVWEFISSEEAVQIIDKCFHRGLGADKACEELVRASKQRWKEKEGDYRDDITAIVVRLDTLWDDEAMTGVGVEK